MKIEILITENRFNKSKSAFRSSFTTLIQEDSDIKKMIEENSNDIVTLIKNDFVEGMEIIIPKHLSIDSTFGSSLNILDSLNCACLTAKTPLGESIKKIMNDNFQLVLTRKHWFETDKLTLMFDAVEYGEVDEFILKMLKRKKTKKAY
jgi:hypothetical protein